MSYPTADQMASFHLAVLPFVGLLLMFAGFILACGATHAISVWNIWHSAYRLEGMLKAVTAILSITTAIVAINLIPKALKIASPEQLEAMNHLLTREVEARKQHPSRSVVGGNATFPICPDCDAQA